MSFLRYKKKYLSTFFTHTLFTQLRIEIRDLITTALKSEYAVFLAFDVSNRMQIVSFEFSPCGLAVKRFIRTLQFELCSCVCYCFDAIERVLSHNLSIFDKWPFFNGLFDLVQLRTVTSDQFYWILHTLIYTSTYIIFVCSSELYLKFVVKKACSYYVKEQHFERKVKMANFRSLY